MKRLLPALLLSLPAILSVPNSAKSATFYVSTSSGQIGEVNDVTGEYSSLISSPAFTDIALSPEGDLWGVTFSSVYSVDLESGVSKVIGSPGGSLNALGFTDDGQLYAIGGNRFYSLNTTTGNKSLVSSIERFSSSGDIVFDAARNLFWATSQGDSLWSITLDGIATRKGNIGHYGVYGLSFGDDNTLFGYTSRGLQLALNLNTGSGSVVQTVSGLRGSIWGAASEPDATAPDNPVSTPEPSLLGGLAIMAMMLGHKYYQRCN